MKRIATALVLIPVVVWIVVAGPLWSFLALAAATGIAAYREFDSIAAAQGIARAGLVGVAAGLALLVAPGPVLPVLAGVALALMGWLALRTGDMRQSLPSAAAALLGVIYIFGAWRCAAGLRDINGHWLMIALLVSWSGDTAAMYVGKAIGRHKLAPVLSPGKTWEGAVASVAGGTVAGAIYAAYFLPEAALWMAVAVAAAGNVAGQFGDLVESAFKRGAGVKDSGSSLPGHGGWLDRMDSSLFSVPAVYVAVLALGGVG